MKHRTELHNQPLEDTVCSRVLKHLRPVWTLTASTHFTTANTLVLYYSETQNRATQSATRGHCVLESIKTPQTCVNTNRFDTLHTSRQQTHSCFITGKHRTELHNQPLEDTVCSRALKPFRPVWTLTASTHFTTANTLVLYYRKTQNRATQSATRGHCVLESIKTPQTCVNTNRFDTLHDSKHTRALLQWNTEQSYTISH